MWIAYIFVDIGGCTMWWWSVSRKNVTNHIHIRAHMLWFGVLLCTWTTMDWNYFVVLCAAVVARPGEFVVAGNIWWRLHKHNATRFLLTGKTRRQQCTHNRQIRPYTTPLDTQYITALCISAFKKMQFLRHDCASQKRCSICAWAIMVIRV